MKIHYSKRFLKQLACIPSVTRTRIESFIFEELPCAISIAETGKFEKMQGYDIYYKIRFGSYRIGIKIEHEVLNVETVMDRKEIYKFFP